MLRLFGVQTVKQANLSIVKPTAAAYFQTRYSHAGYCSALGRSQSMLLLRHMPDYPVLLWHQS